MPLFPRVLLRAAKRVLQRSYIWHSRLLHALGALPLSDNFGWERGTPVGRYYVNAFLRANVDSVRGRCLEFGDARYRSYFPMATEYHVVDVEARPGVDYACDIHDPAGLPQEHFDTVICTQVFEHLAWPTVAAKTLFKILAPGGKLLITAPFFAPVHYVPNDYRRFTKDGLAIEIENAGFTIEVIDYGGNALVSTGSLLGMVAEDFSQAELERKDPIYPYNILLRASRPA